MGLASSGLLLSVLSRLRNTSSRERRVAPFWSIARLLLIYL